MKYYVYTYVDSTINANISFEDIIFTHKPIYIGKGKNNRVLDHFKDRKRFNTYFYNKLNKMILEENIPLVIKLKEFDSEQDAIRMEINLISFLGKKKNGGLLYNITDGGDGISGYKHTEEMKEKLKIINIENNSYLRFPDTKGENHPMFGKKHKQSSIEKMIISRSGTKQTTEWIEKRTSKLRGVPLSDEHKEKLRVANLGKIVSEKTKQKQSLARLGKEPWNKNKIKDIIIQLDTDNNFIQEWYSLIDLEIAGFLKPNIIKVCMGERKTHKGYKWLYKSDFINQN